MRRLVYFPRDRSRSCGNFGGVEKIKIGKSTTMLVGPQDSNLQPDRYERPALTIELQAPPRAIRSRANRQRCQHPLQRSPRSGNAGLAIPGQLLERAQARAPNIFTIGF